MHTVAEGRNKSTPSSDDLNSTYRQHSVRHNHAREPCNLDLDFHLQYLINTDFSWTEIFQYFLHYWTFGFGQWFTVFSDEFQTYCWVNGIHYILVTPYHPSLNRMVEQAVQTFKQNFKKPTENTLEQKLSRLLFMYRLTSHSTTGRSPAEIMLERQPRSRFDLLKPNITQTVK